MDFVVDFWHWWMLGVALIIIEMLIPTFFTMWLGIAAFITGGVLFLFPELAWEYQILSFAVLSIVSIISWIYYDKRHPTETDQPLLNRRGEQYVGRVVTLKTAIEDGIGKVQLDDSTWKVQGEDCPAGTKVKLVSVDNVVFTVEIVK